MGWVECGIITVGICFGLFVRLAKMWGGGLGTWAGLGVCGLCELSWELFGEKGLAYFWST